MKLQTSSALRAGCLIFCVTLMIGFAQFVIAGNLPFLWHPAPDWVQNPAFKIKATPKVRVYVYGDFSSGKSLLSTRLRKEWIDLTPSQKTALPYEFVFEEDIPTWARTVPLLHWQDKSGEWHRWDWAAKQITTPTLRQNFDEVYQATERYVAVAK